MPAHYTIVQYVPDPIADERINVGVIVFGSGQIRSRFLQNWDRVRRFAQEDIGFVREFAERVDAVTHDAGPRSLILPLPSSPEPFSLDEATIRRIADEWSNSIQLTAPQPSLEDPEMLLRRLVQTHLREPVPRARRFRDHQAAARFAASTVRSAFREKLGNAWAEKAVHSGYEIGGKVVPLIRVDLAVTNGRIYAASQSLSFETNDMSSLDWQMRDAVYTLRDIGERRTVIRRDVVVFPPNPDLPNWRKADEKFRVLSAMCRETGAGLIVSDQAPGWAEDLVDLVGTEIAAQELRVAHA
jgi:hypothetical protein